jgi:DNA-binding CsgD family transcriptional regulator
MLCRTDRILFSAEPPEMAQEVAERPSFLAAFDFGRAVGLLDAFDWIGCGCALVDAGGRVVRLNEAARAHLGRGLMLSHGQLVASDRGGNDAFRDLLARVLGLGAAQGELPRGGAVALTRPEGRPLVLHARACREPSGGAIEPGGALIVILDPDAEQAPSAETVRQVFGLTCAEARLAVLLVRGLELKDIAALNGVAEATIRSQLKSVLAKTGTHRQSQLVALLSRLACLPRESG